MNINYIAFSWKQEPRSCVAGRERGSRRVRARWEGDACDCNHAGGQGRVYGGRHGVFEGEQGIHHRTAEEDEACVEVGYCGRRES